MSKGEPVTPADIDRAYFYANTCTKQYEKARDLAPELTYEDWEFLEFTFQYCKEVLGPRTLLNLFRTVPHDTRP